MTLGHTQCTWTMQFVRLADRGWPAGDPGKDGGNCLWSLVLWVACTGTVFYDALSDFSRHCWIVYVYTVSCAHTSDPVSLHCKHSLYNLWLQLAVAGHVCSLVTLPEASTAHDCTDFYT